MTKEEQALDLLMSIISQAKQGKAYNRKLKELRSIAKEDIKAKKIYYTLLNSSEQ